MFIEAFAAPRQYFACTDCAGQNKQASAAGNSALPAPLAAPARTHFCVIQAGLSISLGRRGYLALGGLVALLLIELL
jgi:hypothetical protein